MHSLSYFESCIYFLLLILFEQREHPKAGKMINNLNKMNSNSSNSESTSLDALKVTSGARCTDSARVAKFVKELSGQTVKLGMTTLPIKFALGLLFHLIFDVYCFYSVM